jgi:hypothetical protein
MKNLIHPILLFILLLGFLPGYTSVRLDAEKESVDNMCITPGTPLNPTGNAFSPNQAILDWSPGSPAGSPEITYFWVIGTTPDVTYGNGIAYGTTTDTWLGVISLYPGTTYYLRVYAHTSCNGSSSSYATSAPFTTPGGPSCVTPGTPVGVTATATGPTSASLDWFAGSPAGSSTVTYYWVVGTSPSVAWGSGAAQGSTTSTWVGVNSLLPGTTYYLRVYAHTRCNGSSSSYATSAPFTTPGGPSCSTPGTPVGVTATATGPTSASLDWFAGSPAGSSTVTYYWVVGTSPSVAWGSGTAQGSTTSTWVGVNSLLPGTTYYLRVYAHTSCNGSSSSYATSAAFTTPGGPSCVTPGTPVGVTATATGPTSASLDWFAGSPAGSSTVTYYWVVGTSPSVAWGSGTAQGSTTSTWVGVNSLLPGTTYYLRVYAHTSCNGSSSSYATSAAFTTPGGPSCVTPGTPVGVTATATGPTSASLDWFAGSPAGSSTVTYYWVVGTSPSVAWGSGTAQGSTTSTWVGVNSLLPGTTYYLRVYAHTSCNGSSSSYATSAPFTTPGGPSCVTPGTPVGVTATATGPTSASLDWFAGSPAGSSTVTYYWVVGTSPSVAWGSGTAQGSTTSTWVGVNSLLPGTTYYLRVYAHTSCNGSSSSYATSAVFTTPGGPSCVTPGTPVGVTATATGPTSASLDWFAGSPAGSSTVTYYWVVGTSPSVAWGSGTAQGSTTSTWVGVNSLLPGTTYYLRVYAHTSCNGSSSSYATSAAFTTPGGPSCVTPGTPVGVTATATGPTSASLDWFAGSPAGSSTVTYYWVVGTSPSVAWGSGAAQGSTTSTWVGVNSLLPGTTYYLRVYAHTSCNGSSSSYATSAPFTTPGGPSCSTPGTPVGVTATATGPTSASLDWFAGSPAGSSTVTYYWVVGTSPSVAWGSGTAQGSTTSTWVGVNSLLPGTTYYLRVYAHTSCNGSSSSYATSAAFTTPGGPSCVTPGTPVGVTATATGPTSASLDWFAGSPAGSSTVTYYWVVGTSPSVAWGSGTAQGSTTSTWVGVNSLLPGTTYYLRVYAHTSCNGSSSSYATSASFTTPGGPSCVTPGTPVGVTATATGQTSASLDWFAGSPAGSSTVTYYWVVGTSPSVAWGSGTAQGSTTSTWVGVNSLLPGTTYYLRVYAHTSCNGSSSSYATSASFTTPGGPSCVTPGTPVGVTATVTGSTSANLNWSGGSPAGSPTVTYYWVIGTSSSVTYGNGMTQGYTALTSFSLNNLQSGTTYYLRVYARTDCNGSVSTYATSAAFTTSGGCVAPSLQASNISFSNVSPQQFRIQWTNGNGTRRIVKINTLNGFTLPNNGSDPTPNSHYSGSGEQIVYNGTGNNVTVTGLPLNSTIWVRIFEANCSGVNSVYNIINSTNNPSSQRTITVLPAMSSFVGSEAGLNSNNEEIQIPFYTIRDFDESIPLMHLLSDGSTSTRFTLTASNARSFGFRVVDSIGRVVTDSNRTLDLARFGKLDTSFAVAHDKLVAKFTHPTIPHTSFNQNLKLQILYEGGLLGLDIPISFLRPAAPLAAELVDFSGKYLASQHVNQLQWTTLSEYNNDYFEIQRSIGNGDFEAIGKVSGINRPNLYSYTDHDIAPTGVHIYRLRQVDYDGTETLSDQIAIKVTGDTDVKTRISPNPATNLVHVQIEGNTEDNVRVHLFNMSGQRVISDMSEKMTGDVQIFELNTSSLQKGMYNLVIQIKDRIFHHKLLIVD